MRRGLLKRNATLLDIGMRMADPVLVVLAGIAAHALYLGGVDLPDRYVVALICGALLAAAVFPYFGLYQSQRGSSFVAEAGALGAAWLAIFVIGGAFLFLTKTGESFSRGFALIWLTGGLLAHLAFRAATRAALRLARRAGHNLRHVVIAGAGAHGRRVAAGLRNAPSSGLRVRAFYDDQATLAGTFLDGVPVAGDLDRLATDAIRDPPDQVWIALRLRDEERINALVDALRQATVVIRFVPDIYEFHLINHSMSDIAGMPVLNLTDSPHTGVLSVLKLVEDYLLSTLILAISLPLWVVIAVGVKLSSPGPIFYRQERVTWNGQRFSMIKFRTMPVDTERRSGPVWSRHGESRATVFGRFLRRLSLDELPQLLNVLRGEMSLIGPRPERPEFVERFRREIPGYMQKHLVKAGITGWAQVNDFRGDSDLKQRINYDLYYIENWSLTFDIRILFLTLWHIIASRNAS